MFERLNNMLDEELVNKIKNSKILIVGIGGVGGFALEALIRSGVEDITIVDNDIVEESNLNRQIIALIFHLIHIIIFLYIRSRIRMKAIGIC